MKLAKRPRPARVSTSWGVSTNWGVSISWEASRRNFWSDVCQIWYHHGSHGNLAQGPTISVAHVPAISIVHGPRKTYPRAYNICSPLAYNICCPGDYSILNRSCLLNWKNPKLSNDDKYTDLLYTSNLSPGCRRLTSNGLYGLRHLQRLQELEVTNCPGANSAVCRYLKDNMPTTMIIEWSLL